MKNSYVAARIEITTMAKLTTFVMKMTEFFFYKYLRSIFCKVYFCFGIFN